MSSTKSTYTAKQWILKSYLSGAPKDENFEYRDVSVDVSKGLESGKVLIQLLYLSVDPYMRIRMNKKVPKGYFSSFPLNKPLQGACIAKVIQSNDPKLKEGDIVNGLCDFQNIQIVDAKSVNKYHFTNLPLSYGLGILGLNGATAYFGLLRLTEPKKGEKVLVSGAAGGVGYIVGMIAKLKGCQVVGIAGSDEKCKTLTDEFGFDAAINYKKASNIESAIKEKYPDGFDIFFDNVGGETFDAAIKQINSRGRISLCGSISSYNNKSNEVETGIRIPTYCVVKELRIEGFLVSRWLSEWGEAFKEIAQWISEGKLVPKETVTKGFENTIEAFKGMMSGKNIGKQVVEL